MWTTRSMPCTASSAGKRVADHACFKTVHPFFFHISIIRPCLLCRPPAQPVLQVRVARCTCACLSLYTYIHRFTLVASFIFMLFIGSIILSIVWPLQPHACARGLPADRALPLFVCALLCMHAAVPYAGGAACTAAVHMEGGT